MVKQSIPGRLSKHLTLLIRLSGISPFKGYVKFAWSKLVKFNSCLVFLCIFPNAAVSMPEGLYQGLVKYKLESGNYFSALVLMDDALIEADQVSYIRALEGFNINQNIKEKLSDVLAMSADKTEIDYFSFGKAAYFADECVIALKAFKKLKNKLSLKDKQEWAFYRANCFIKLRSKVRAAQVLSDILGGIWASHAYYNLAMAYVESSSNTTKALFALRVALSLNKGETREERELNDRINYAAGALYLENGKPDIAAKFFKKIHLESASAPPALYLNGVANLDLNEFRAATQSWFSIKKYPLIFPGVSQAFLAIPYAYERSGYVGQALEAYLEASESFRLEAEAIKKIITLLEKHGIQKVLIEENKIEGLEWFLAKDIAKNTRRASYYSHLMRENDMHDKIELLFELKELDRGLAYWSSQLNVFDKSLIKKRKSFNKKSRTFNSKKVKTKISGYESKLHALETFSSSTTKPVRKSDLEDMNESISSLRERLSYLKKKITSGGTQLKQQITESARLNARIKSQRDDLHELIAELDIDITGLVIKRLTRLREEMLYNFERSEQGLVHIFENMADEDKNRPQVDLLDGRYR